MLDRERILAKIDELDGYLREIRQIMPSDFKAYQKMPVKRACERLLQISVESAIDICSLLVSGLRLGLPAEEDDLFDKLEEAGIISSSMKEQLKKMKGFRNILVHEYGRVDDRLVFEVLQNRLDDFKAFKGEILQAIHQREGDSG